jgi:dolichyl-phosphate-mannose--protein O-mannosyl transferase
MTAGTDVFLGAVLLALAAGGYAWGRWKAVLWIGVVPWLTLSLGADAAWWSGLWDRSEEYEPLPLSMFVIPIWIPACCTAVAVAVALRRARLRRTDVSS